MKKISELFESGAREFTGNFNKPEGKKLLNHTVTLDRLREWAKEWRKEVNDRLDKVNEECKTVNPTSLHWRQLHCELEHLLSMTTQITEKFELEEDLK